MQIQFNTVNLCQLDAKQLRAHADWFLRLGHFFQIAADDKDAGRAPEQMTDIAPPDNEEIVTPPHKISEPSTEQPQLRIMKAARKLAEDSGVSLKDLAGKGTGKNGMVTQADVKKHIEAISPPDAKGNGQDLDDLDDGANQPSLIDVRKKLTSIVQDQGPVEAKDLLKKFNIDKISELPESKYEAFIKQADALLAQGLMD